MAKRRLQDERGQVIVLAAVMIPVFLLLTALVVDVGNWYSHKRQLQNRADAGALAAGEQLTKVWPACITDAAKEATVMAAAKQFSGDPATAGAVNTEIADQSKFNTQVNSTGYSTGSDNTDGASGPCQPHPATPGTENESNITPGGGTWIDVKVKERDTKSLFGAFGVDLLQNRARARVELHEASAGDQFVPLAIPEEDLDHARIRFINDCNGSVLAASDLKKLQQPYQTDPTMTLWGPASGSAPSVAPGQIPFSTPNSVPVPNTAGCGDSQRDYTPIRVEVRVAGRSDINIGDSVSCATLQAKTSADCYPNISQIRVYQPAAGLFGDRPQIRDVSFSPSGARPCVTDPYYSRTTATPNCTFDASVFMDWGSRPTANATFQASVSVDGSTAVNMSGSAPQSTWTAAQVPISTVGPHTVRVSWRYELTNGTWPPGGLTGCTNKNNNPCVQQGTTAVHQVNLGDDPSGSVDPPSDVVGAVKFTSGPYDPKVPQAPVNSAETGTTFNPIVTVGFRSSIRPGSWAVLRLRSGQRNFSVICDPFWDQPSSVDAMAAFYYGCQPPYGTNDTSTSSFWWNTSTESCPAASSWFSYSGTYPNQTYPNSPWRCVQLDVGGNGFSVGDGIALATDNCRSPSIDPIGPGSKATCTGGGPNAYQCNHPPTYFGGTNYPDVDTDPRVIKLFIVPWGAYKNVQSGNGQIVPVLRLAAFYVTAWHFNKGNDPCPGNENARLGSEMVGGYFIKPVETSGPVNRDKDCNPDDVNLCYVGLTR
jgi:Flp pilus assembly protein TadG